MIDTLKIYFPAELTCPGPKWDLMQIGTNKSGYHDKYVYHDKTLRLTLLEVKWAGVRLIAEASLPKLLRDNNIAVLDLKGIRSALTLLDNRVRINCPNIDIPHITQAELSRVDYCTAWKVDDPDAYVRDISSAATARKGHSVARHDNRGGYGLGWNRDSNGWSERLYNKRAETEYLIAHTKPSLASTVAATWLDDSEGMLRYEVTAKRDELRKVIGEPTVAALLRHLETCGNSYLAGKWANLTRYWQPVSASEVMRLLRARYGVSRNIHSLFDCWASIAHIGLEQYKAVTQIASSTLARKLKMLRDANVRLGADITLPVLEVPTATSKSASEKS